MTWTLDDYQEYAAEFGRFPNRTAEDLYHCAFGIAEEAGEVAGKLKRVLRDDDGVVTLTRREEILSELGDTLWYVSAVARLLDYTLETVAVANIVKLCDRQRNGTLQGSGDKR